MPQEDDNPKGEKPSETTSKSLADVVAPEPKPEPKKPVEELKHVIGKISGLRSKEYGEVTRTIIDIGDKSYGTSDKIISEILTTSLKFNAEVAIFYEEKQNSKGKTYNEKNHPSF
jgi:hypothetical protein